MTFEDARNWAIIIAAIVALATFVKALHEYALENRRKRAEMFLNMRASYKSNERFSDIFEMLEEDNEQLVRLEYSKKQDFLGFYEDLALLVNAGVLKIEVAHYMFGYYAIKCWESQNFWHDMNRDSPYWCLFRLFVAKMHRREKILEKNPSIVTGFKI